MTKAALLVSLLAAACTDQGIEAEYDVPTTPLPSEAVTKVEGHKVIVATGGTAAVLVLDKTSIGLEGNASQGYVVEPHFVRWPNTVSPEYWIRANVSGAGSYEIVTSKGIATGLVHSADLARVELRPANYELDGTSPFALSAARTQIEAALYDAQGRRLVDATLAIGAEQTSWDRATLPAATGTQSIAVFADSFAERAITVDVVDSIDRIERTSVGDRTCFHAYAGATEVVVAMTFDGGTADPTAANCTIAPTHAAPNVLYR